ncbi:MAG: flavin-containing monooxygenase [Solirubrobacteraceae bacterium]
MSTFAPAPSEQQPAAAVRDFRVAIVGCGFSGLGMAIGLLEEGERDFVILERGDDVGGAWRENTYPGCQCDVPSHLYSLSFAPNPNWSRTYSRQEEIWEYMRDLAARHGLYEKIRFGHEACGAQWDSERQRWTIETTQGSFTAKVLVGAMGPLDEPALPQIPGIEKFAGTSFHSARWDHEKDLSGERVAVIGTGASAIQFVPRIQPRVEKLLVFQRTAPWVMPHTDRPVSAAERALFRLFPPAQRAVRAAIYWAREALVVGFAKHGKLMAIPEGLARNHLQRQVSDPELRERLTPRYRIGCKRILVSNRWYPALQQPNVELVCDGIAEVREHSVVTSQGVEHPVDTIIYGTGFHITDAPSAHYIRGADGRTLAETWQGSAKAYLGTSVAGFPNLFMLIGPNTGLGHSSMVYMIESQLQYVLDCLRKMKRENLGSVDVRPEVQSAYNSELQQRMPGTVWMSGCASWYIDADGNNTTVWPDFTFRFRRRTRAFDPLAYHLVPAGRTTAQTS